MSERVIDEANPDFTAEEEAKAVALMDLPVGRKIKASSWMFDCPKAGHSFDPDMMPMMAMVQDHTYGVRICIACGCPVYIPLGIRTSDILGPQGQQIQIDE